MSESTYDAIVVGGRVAGALTAAELAAQGRSVLVLESRTFPSATLSTHFFRGDGLLRCLAKHDLLEPVLRTGAPPLTCEYFFAGGSAEGSCAPPQEPGEVGFSLSVRREQLDAIVAEHVAGLPGVDLRFGVRVEDLVTEDGIVMGVRMDDGQEHRAGVTVGADGRRSVVARRAGAGDEQRHAGERLMYYRYVAGWGAQPDGVGAEFSLSGNEMVYVFPSDSGLACIALTVAATEQQTSSPDTEAYFAARLQAHDGLWPRYAAAQPQSALFCGLPEDSVLRKAAGPGWALVGDAGTHQDPWSGLGMDTAARQAEALGAVLTEDPTSWNEAYAASRDRVTLDGFAMTVGIAPDLSVMLG